jgi:hypothetical protein
MWQQDINKNWSWVPTKSENEVLIKDCSKITGGFNLNMQLVSTSCMFLPSWGESSDKLFIPFDPAGWEISLGRLDNVTWEGAATWPLVGQELEFVVEEWVLVVAVLLWLPLSLWLVWQSLFSVELSVDSWELVSEERGWGL